MRAAAAALALILLANGGLALGGAPAAAQAAPDSPSSTVVDLPTRRGVTVRLLLLVPARARAAVAMLPGSAGLSSIPDGATADWTRGGSLLVRSSPAFRERGVMVAIVDAPSDRRRGVTTGFRASAAHMDDIAAVIAEMRRRAGGLPVWLMGHSSGTISVANAAAQLAPPRGPDGIVLASSVAYPLGAGGRGPGMAAIRVPTLLVHNRGDGCTPFGGAQALRATLTGAPRAELLAFDAQPAPQARRCGRFAAHGFNGVEDQAVAAIVAWIDRR